MSDFEQEFLHSVVTLQAPSTAPSSGESEGPDPAAGCVMQAGMIALLFLLMYFFLIRPENKRREEHEKMLNSLRPGQKVRTSSGILGEIVSIDDYEAILAIGQREKIRVSVLRSHIAGLEAPRAPKEAKEERSKVDEKGEAGKLSERASTSGTKEENGEKEKSPKS